MKKVEDEPKLELTPQAPKKGTWTILNKDLLPSRGKYYPNDITVRKLNAQEIKDLTKLPAGNVAAANAQFNLIISNCLQGVDVNDILINDKLWLMYYLRSITYYDQPYEVKYTCPVCGSVTKEKYVLNKLLVNYYDKELPKEITLPNGDVVEPTWPTIGTEKAIKALKENPQIIEVIDDELLTIVSHIKTINGKKMSLYDLFTYFTGDDSRGSGYDFAYFCNSFKKYIFGARPYFTVECACGETNYCEIGLTPDFFLPNLD